MSAIQIVDLNTNKPIFTFQPGIHVLGRGEVLKCSDRRVSRNHAILNVTENGCTITSTHQNPCFYQANSSGTIVILPKDKPIPVTDGDKFSLLADQFWYKFKNFIQSCRENDQSENPINSFSKVSQCDDVENVAESNNYVKISECDNANDFNTSEEYQTELETSHKKRKLGIDKNVVVNSNVETKENSSEQEQSLKVPIQKGKKIKNAQNKDRSPSNKNDINDIDELLSLLQNSDEDSQQKSNNYASGIRNNVSAEVSNEVEMEESEITETLNELSGESAMREVKHDETPGSSNQANFTEENSNDGQNSASTSNDKQKRYRDRCWYGMNCYRKNPSHLAEFKHPGDSDYETDPDDEKPNCPFGTSCYRKNKEHRKQFKHAGTLSKPLNKTGRNKRNTNTTKKPANKKNAASSEEDDYDLDDPFIDDSGTEYEASSSEEDDGDSDRSGEPEDDTKRLFKEAKKFTKKGK